jgi:hypothetical protein
MPNGKITAAPRISNPSVRSVSSRPPVRSHEQRTNVSASVRQRTHVRQSEFAAPPKATRSNPLKASTSRSREIPIPSIPPKNPAVQLRPDRTSTYGLLSNTLHALPIVPQRNGRDVLSARIAAEIQAEADAELDLIALKSLFIQPFNTEPTDHLQKLKLLRLNLLKLGIRPNEITEVILPKDTKVIHPSWHDGLSLNTGGIVVYEEKIIDSKTSLEKLMQSARADERNFIDSAKVALDTRCIAQKLPEGITRYFLPGLQYTISLESLTDKFPTFSALNKTLPIRRLG